MILSVNYDIISPSKDINVYACKKCWNNYTDKEKEERIKNSISHKTAIDIDKIIINKYEIYEIIETCE